jgi:hypothetical protein
LKTQLLTLILTLVVSSQALAIDLITTQQQSTQTGASTSTGPRISSDQAKNIRDEVIKQLKLHREENNGKIDLVVLEPDLFDLLLDEFDFKEDFNNSEFATFQRRFNDIKAQTLTDNQKESAILSLLDQTITEVASAPLVLQCRPENAICNNNPCCEGLSCSPAAPTAPAAGSLCQNGGNACTEDSQCCSGACSLTGNGNEKVCQDVSVCKKAVPLGGDCSSNGLCEVGDCQQIDTNTSGLPACVDIGETCSENSDCCSDKCNGGVCSQNIVCIDCVPAGSVPTRGRECCPGLITGVDGQCISDAPPITSSNETLGGSAVTNSNAAITGTGGSVSAANAQIESTIKANPGGIDDPNAGFQEVVDLIGVLPKYKDVQISDLLKCDINFRNDYRIMLERGGVYNIEAALLAFEYMVLGPGTQDYWKDPGKGVNIHDALSTVAEEHRSKRRKIFEEDIPLLNKRLKCICLARIGLDKITDPNKGQFFQENCPAELEEFNLEKQLAELSGVDEAEGDASGVKYKKMIVAWTGGLKQFQELLLLANTDLFVDMEEISTAVSEAPYDETEIKDQNVFNFTVLEPNGGGGGGGGSSVSDAALGAIIIGGVVAIVAGFAAGATIGAWASVGIISSTAAASIGAIWLVGALRGAWLSEAPNITDETIKGRVNYKCGKKQRCTDYKRILNQPFNKICRKHISANACIRSFLATDIAQIKDPNAKEGEFVSSLSFGQAEPDNIGETDTTRYIIDPWIPFGVPAESVIKDFRSYADLLEQGYKNALSQMKGMRPGGRVNPSYLDAMFIDSLVVGKYTPPLQDAIVETYFFNEPIQKLIVEKAKRYAITEKFFLESEEEDLETFAEYALTFHYIFPKLSTPGQIAYPPPGLATYVDSVANGLQEKAENNLENQTGLADLNKKHQIDLQNSLKRLRAGSNFESEAGKKLVAILDRQLLALEDDIKNGTSFAFLGLSAGIDGLTDTKAGLSGAGGSGATSAGNIAGNAANVANATNALRRARERQAAELKNFQDKIGDTARGKKLLAASRNFSNSFKDPLSGSKVSAADRLEQFNLNNQLSTEEKEEEEEEDVVINKKQKSSATSPRRNRRRRKKKKKKTSTAKSKSAEELSFKDKKNQTGNDIITKGSLDLFDVIHQQYSKRLYKLDSKDLRKYRGELKDEK